jgi:3-hydroxybutyryl-CoA dehydrogenase
MVIGVLGAGTMGSGIAQVAAQSGFDTLLFDVQAAAIEKARAGIEKNLRVLTEKNKLTPEQAEATAARIRYTTQTSDCIADVIIEAIIEKIAAKTDLFNELAGYNSADTIFATNTSSLSVTTIQAAVVHPDRVAGMHFFNPAPLMKLVEVVRGAETSEATLSTLVQLATQMGKTPVVCKDAPGFIVNRVARPYYLEAMRLVASGATTPADADAILQATGFRMGPFALMDLIGLDINYAVSCSVYEQMGKPDRLRPAAMQEAKVREGKLGRKTGEGFYTYHT